MRKFLLFLICVPLFVFSQSITPERVTKIKTATVRVTIEGIAATGSAFFISASGELLTCWHVIEPAFLRDSLGNMRSLRKIYIEEANGTKSEVSIPLSFYQKLYLNARGIDYCLLAPVKPFAKPKIFYKPGDFNKVPEGQELYSCGYPVGMEQPFLFKGVLSTRYIDSSTYYFSKGVQQKIYRDVGLLNLSLNKGCSGGPIIKPGATINDDEVVGIANFMISPYGQSLEEMYSLSNVATEPNTSPMINVIKLFSAVAANVTNGMSSCLSINHFINDIQLLQK